MIVFLIVISDCLFLLLPLVNQTAFTAMIGVATVSFGISYVIPIALRVTAARNNFKKSHFHLGKYSIIIGWISTLWLIFTCIVFNFPTAFNENGN